MAVLMDVVALLAHPDDELMCAGTLARLVDEGHLVRLATLFMDERKQEWGNCAKTLGADAEFWREKEWDFDFGFYGHGATPSDSEDDFVWSRRVVSDLEEWAGRPDLLISHRAEDANTSHGHLGRIARTLARKNRCDLWELDLTLPGGINPDAPGPNHFVDITTTIDRKRDAIACYASQLERYPGWADAIDARDRLYGWQLHMTTEPRWAEGFRIVKSVWL